ncbi:hypothetical protein C7974DRAFT_315357 [Boeremia exigua]|uniref:uncharacterized protein n=1 Tax=Boeremia exigua TaxID=749465 RepID=UPI001E8D7703|nr:uncharacterized protein C7974DRAFT_315357 [Boeremia exigua]KAH6621762.1 hypothetical protein C7974DRAFT_315357 [Boeremia exigua]
MGAHLAADPPHRRPPPPLPNRPAEPASDDLWEKSRNKGCTLSWAMQANDADVGPAYTPHRDNARSPFRSFSDLQTWGWNPFPPDEVDESFHNFYSAWGIGEALVSLGVSEYSDIYKGGKNRLICIDHRSYDPDAGPVDEQRYDANGKVYRATGASYAFTINPKEGVIMALNRLSPNYAATDRNPHVPVDQLPALNQFSDVAWIGWDAVTREEGEDIKGLRYFLAVGIVNPFTKRVIRRAMDTKGWELSPWPGHTFERQWFETRAIIGTPNVQGFAYMLIQHKDVLGNMFIDKVQVFRANTASRNPCIVLHLAKPRALEQREVAKTRIVERVKVVEVRAKL